MKKLSIQSNEEGIAPILILVAVVGLIAFFGIASIGGFKGGVFSELFSKTFSHASGPGVIFVDNSNVPVSSITAPTTKLQLTAPWPPKNTGFNFVQSTYAQTGSTSITSQIKSSTDNVNEDGSSFDTTSGTTWIGNGQSTTSSYTGLRFSNINLPKGASISSAKLQVYSASDQWISVGISTAAQNTGNSQTFSSSNKPSQQSLTNSKISSSTNTKWAKNTWYTLDEIGPVLQELVNRSDWNSGNSISLVIKGTGGAYGRKNVVSFNGSSANAPKLLISYSGGSATSPSVAPSSVPNPSPVVVPSPAVTPSPAVKTASAVVAEDNAFTQNVVNISPYPTTDPYYLAYTFSNPTPGTKTIYVKFTSSTGEQQSFSSSITLIAPSPSPMASMPAVGGGGAGTNAQAMGLWVPNVKYDTCPSYPSGVTTDQQKSDYIKSVHDAYKVQGPDGKWYPTWHPAVDPTTGCKFGHEHGSDPSKSMIWNEVKQYYAYDANKNGVIDSSELAVSGIPFGYANEQLDSYNSGVVMRHEDHVGHKVEWANGEADIATDQFDKDTDQGVVVPAKGGAKWVASGARCYHFAKVHQGVNSPDATMMNLHEVVYFVDCKGPTDAYNMQTGIDVLSAFGAPGEFTNLCDAENDRTTPVVTGKNATNQNYPGTRGRGDRNIIQRSCIEKYFLVKPPTFSMNMYEAWRGTQNITTAAGKTLLTANGLFFDVEDSSRYYWPGHTDPNTGQANVGRSMDLCYENLNGAVARTSMCDSATNYGAIKDIKWDDPRSAFKGEHRGMYFQPPVVSNAGGPTVWYTDPFGGNAQTTPFPGSIKQVMPSKNVDHGKLGATDPRVNDRDHGGVGVHAPN